MILQSRPIIKHCFSQLTSGSLNKVSNLFLNSSCRTGQLQLVAYLFTIGNQSIKMNRPYIVTPSGEHKKTLIFLHGLGDNGSGWSQTLEEVVPANWKIIAPNATSKPVTLNVGMLMPSWFDILGLSASSNEDEEGIRKASQEIQQLIDQEVQESGISSDNIVLGGFSQGGALALYSGLTYDKKLAAIVGLSTWIPLRNEVPSKVTDANKDVKIFQAHGHIDPIVAFNLGEMTKMFLNQNQIGNITFKAYPSMMHGSCEQELSDLRSFLASL